MFNSDFLEFQIIGVSQNKLLNKFCIKIKHNKLYGIYQIELLNLSIATLRMIYDYVNDESRSDHAYYDH